MENLVIASLQKALSAAVESGLQDYPLARKALSQLLRKWIRHPFIEDHLRFGDDIIGNLEKLWAANPQKKRILYVVFYPLPNVLRQSLALQQTGDYVTAIIGACNREELRLEAYCDANFECENPAILGYILKRVQPDLLHAVTGPSHIPCLAALFSRAPLIVEIYDSLIFLWKDFKKKSDYEMEVFSLARAGGIQHKYTRQGHFLLKAHYQIKVPLIQFHCFVTKDFFGPNKPKALDSFPHLVYTGGLMPPQRAIELGHTCLLFGEMIREVVRQGIHLTIYANQNSRDMRWHRQKLYYDLEERFPAFEIRSGVPVDRIAMAAYRFHFGFFYDNFNNLGYHPQHYSLATATKMYSYLEMGLPLLVYPQFKFIHDLVVHYGIGLEYDLQNLSNLRRTIENAEYSNLVQAVTTFRETIRIDRFLSELETFHQMVLMGKKAKDEFDHFFPLEVDAPL